MIGRRIGEHALSRAADECVDKRSAELMLTQLPAFSLFTCRTGSAQPVPGANNGQGYARQCPGCSQISVVFLWCPAATRQTGDALGTPARPLTFSLPPVYLHD